MYWTIKKTAAGILVFMLALLLTVQAVFAAGAGEHSNSPGIPVQKPLNFEGITLVDGGEDVRNATDIPAGKPRFRLQFDKNVVNSTIWEINRQCFSMVSQDNESIPLRVMKVDDTIDFSQRQVIFIESQKSIGPGTAYELKVSPSLKAKNGVSTLGGTTNGQGITISFRTETQAETQTAGQNITQTNNEKAQPEAAVSGSEANNAVGNANSTADTESQYSQITEATAGQQQAATSAAGETAGSGFNRNYTAVLTILAVVLIAGWIAVEMLVNKKKRG